MLSKCIGVVKSVILLVIIGVEINNEVIFYLNFLLVKIFNICEIK